MRRLRLDTQAGVGAAIATTLNVAHGVDIGNPSLFQSLTALTVECWCQVQGTNSGPYTARLADNLNAGANTGFSLRAGTTGVAAGFSAVVGNGTTSATVTTATITDGRYSDGPMHVAVTWDGTTVTLWVNGASAATAALSGGNTGNSGTRLTLSNTSFNGQRALPGSIGLVRLSNTARYTGTFTPPTSYTVDANTVGLWLCNEGRGVTAYDSSGNANHGTLKSGSGTAPVPAWAPGLLFATNAPTVRAVAAAPQALLFSNATGAGFQIAQGVTGPLQGLTALTVEAWVLVTGPASVGVARFFSFTGAANTGFFCGVGGSGAFTSGVGNGTTTSAGPTASAVIYGRPVHVALTWDGTTVTLWVNGASASTAALSGGTTGNPGAAACIGNNGVGGTRGFPGWVQELRVSNSARYTVGFTPQLTPFATDANTVGLWHCNEGYGGTAYDSSGNALHGAFGGAPVPQWVQGTLLAGDAAPQRGLASPVAGAPALSCRPSAGNGGAIAANNAAFQGLTALTVEAWMLLDGPCTVLERIFYFTGGNGNSTGFGLTRQVSNALLGTVGNGTTGVQPQGGTVRYGTPQHAALTWDGTTVTLWLNGVSVATAALSGGNTGNPGAIPTIGNNGAGGGAIRALGGWVQELRVSNLARYTVGFTPQLTPFASDANTVALWHCNEGRGLVAYDSGPNALHATLAGVPLPQWVPGYLGSPSGQRPQAVPTSPAALQFGLNSGGNATILQGLTGPLQGLTAFSVEAVIYPAAQPPVGGRVFTFLSGNTGFLLGLGGNANSLFFQAGNGTTSANQTVNGVIPLGKAAYIALTWDGANLKAYVNAVLVNTTALSGGNTGNPSGVANIGNNGAGAARGFPGWIQELRVSNNVRTIAVPTAPYVADANTLGLWHLSEGFGATAYDSSGNAMHATFGGSPLPQWVQGSALGSLLPATSTPARQVVPQIVGPYPAIRLAAGAVQSYAQYGGSPTALNSLTALTLEAWVRYDSIQTAFGGRLFLWFNSPNGFLVEGSRNAGLNTAALVIGNGTAATAGPTVAVPSGVWVHLAFDWDGASLYAYLNGVYGGNSTAFAGPNTGVPTNSSLQIGQGLTNGYNGALFDLRISNIARYHGVSFTPPTAPYVTDANTLALWHCSEGGGQTLFDSGPNGYHAAFVTTGVANISLPQWDNGPLVGAV